VGWFFTKGPGAALPWAAKTMRGHGAEAGAPVRVEVFGGLNNNKNILIKSHY
jgi:hypothetical protein